MKKQYKLEVIITVNYDNESISKEDATDLIIDALNEAMPTVILDETRDDCSAVITSWSYV